MSEKQLSGVPRTMIFTLRARADEHARPDGLFRDERAAQWIKRLPWDAELEEWYAWNYQVGIAVRTELFDDVARRHIATHDNPLVVELGAGLSTRYHRVGRGRARWVELDLPEVIDIRRQLDVESDEHTFMACSALDFEWMEQLPDAPPENILFIAEGLLNYFAPADVRRLVRRMRECFLGATFAIEVLGQSSKKMAAKGAARSGAAMKWFVRDERDVAALGLTLIHAWPMMRQHLERWRWLRWISWVPAIRNSDIIVETKIEPVER